MVPDFLPLQRSGAAAMIHVSETTPAETAGAPPRDPRREKPPPVLREEIRLETTREPLLLSLPLDRLRITDVACPLTTFPLSSTTRWLPSFAAIIVSSQFS